MFILALRDAFFQIFFFWHTAAHAVQATFNRWCKSFWHTAAHAVQATFNRWCKSRQSDAFHGVS